MSTKKQFKMYLSDELIERLKIAAEKIGKSSSQEVAEEILSIYLPVWSNVNDSMNRAVGYQIKKVSEEAIKEVKAKVPAAESLNFSGGKTKKGSKREALLDEVREGMAKSDAEKKK